MRKIILCLLSLLFFSLPWLGLPGYFVLVAFVPLFLLQDELEGEIHKKGKPRKILPYVLVTFFLWNALTVWWVGNSVWFAAPAAMLVNTFVSTLPFMAYHYVRKRAPRPLAYAVLISAWVGYEFIYTHGQITFPWLILGNGFAHTVKAIQWYEFTGVLGGSLWIFACNIAVYEAIRAYRLHKSWKVFIRPASWFLVPFLLSLGIYYSYREAEDPIKVQLIQPNFDPYEKFTALSNAQQIEIILDQAMKAPSDVDYFLAPETAIDGQLWEEEIPENGYVSVFRYLLRERYPAAEFIIGATTLKLYPTEEESSFSARHSEQLNIWYDVYNSALEIDTSRHINIYHKSKLVAGAEMIPYYRHFKFLGKLSVDLGGSSGQFGVDDERSVFTSTNGVSVGVPICWEAVFGEYCTDYIKKGAQALFIISNDAWWEDTQGYKQLFAYSRLRAIETRRSVARSANTGISGFINQRGDVLSRTEWDERVSRTGEINRNDKVTFYVKFGDMIGRICLLVFVLCILYYVAWRRKKKDYLME